MEKVNAGTHTVRAWLLTGVDLSLHLQGLSIAVLWIQIVQILSAVRLLLPAGWALPLFELLEGSAIFFVNHRDNRLAKALTHERLKLIFDLRLLLLEVIRLENRSSCLLQFDLFVCHVLCDCRADSSGLVLLLQDLLAERQV